MYRIIWSDLALMRVEEIADFCAREDPVAAASFIERLFDRVGVVAEHPRLAPRHPLVDDEAIRQLVHEAWVVAYRIDDTLESVTVLTVRHGRQRAEPPPND